MKLFRYRPLRLGAALAPALALALAGCGNSKNDAAISRALNRPSPGFARIVNLTNDVGDLTIGKFTPVKTIEPGTACIFHAAKVGKNTISSSLLDKPVEVELESDQTVSLYVLGPKGNRTVKAVYDEPRRVEGGAVVVAFISADEKGKYMVKADDILEPKAAEVFRAGTTSKGAAPGTFTATITPASGTPIPVEINAENRGAYTVLIQVHNGKPEAKVFQNHPANNPQAGGGLAG